MYTLKKEDKETEAKRDEEKRVSVSESAVCFLSSSGTVNPTHWWTDKRQTCVSELTKDTGHHHFACNTQQENCEWIFKIVFNVSLSWSKRDPLIATTKSKNASRPALEPGDESCTFLRFVDFIYKLKTKKKEFTLRTW